MGEIDGVCVGRSVGVMVGEREGRTVGVDVGNRVGAIVPEGGRTKRTPPVRSSIVPSPNCGVLVGTALGAIVSRSAVGKSVGWSVGTRDGNSVGTLEP